MLWTTPRCSSNMCSNRAGERADRARFRPGLGVVMTDSMQEPGPDQDGGEGPDLVARVVAGAGNCPADIVTLAEVLAAATEMPVTGDLATGAGVADRVTVLGRLVAVLEAEAGRALAVADQNSLLPHAPVTHLQRHAGWTGRAASALTVASRFAARHPGLAELWPML